MVTPGCAGMVGAGDGAAEAAGVGRAVAVACGAVVAGARGWATVSRRLASPRLSSSALVAVMNWPPLASAMQLNDIDWSAVLVVKAST